MSLVYRLETGQVDIYRYISIVRMRHTVDSDHPSTHTHDHHHLATQSVYMDSMSRQCVMCVSVQGILTSRPCRSSDPVARIDRCVDRVCRNRCDPGGISRSIRPPSI
jgi:hypothetical protein